MQNAQQTFSDDAPSPALAPEAAEATPRAHGTVPLPDGVTRHNLDDIFVEARRRLQIPDSLQRFAQKYTNAVENYLAQRFKSAFELLNALKNTCDSELTTTKAFVHMIERCEECMHSPPLAFNPVFESKEK
jgi:hypothetical protein